MWPAWVGIGTPLTFSLWLVNRLATWTGLIYLWRRVRFRRFAWVWLSLINVASLGALGLVFYWLHQSRR